MKQLHFETRSQWRQWLAKNHDQEKDGVWLLLHRKNTGRPVLCYEESVEEALCFGWIDSLAKSLDSERRVQRFSPRRKGGNWTEVNRAKARRLIEEGRMTEAGKAALPQVANG